MKIYLLGDSAFVDVGKGYMLCIGSKTEVDGADERQLIEMIVSAMIWSQYRSISKTVGKPN